MEANICEVERLGIHDGPGIRTVVFLKGCPLRCLWCSNPETQLFEDQIYYNKKKCISCKNCVDKCEGAVLFEEKWEFSPEKGKCADIKKCISSCPTGALQKTSEKMSTEEVFKIVMKDYAYYRNSNGGVTLSGGEVLSQTDFAHQLLSMVKEEYISTAIETTGYGSYENLKKLAEVADYVLYDLKHMDSVTHKRVTGVPNELILENLKKLSAWHKNIIIRFPLIMTINDSEENIYKTAEFVKSLGLSELHLLPYHTLGLEKYRQLQMEYPMKVFEKHSREVLEKANEIIESLGIHCKLNG